MHLSQAQCKQTSAKRGPVAPLPTPSMLESMELEGGASWLALAQGVGAWAKFGSSVLALALTCQECMAQLKIQRSKCCSHDIDKANTTKFLFINDLSS